MDSSDNGIVHIGWVRFIDDASLGPFTCFSIPKLIDQVTLPGVYVVASEPSDSNLHTVIRGVYEEYKGPENMPKQITFYHDTGKISSFCYRVEIALIEAGATYTSHGLDIYNKPEWFARVNPLTGKIPVLTYGGPTVHPEEPSPLSAKITESCVILEFLADTFPNSTLLPPMSDPTARARVRFFVDASIRYVEIPFFEAGRKVPGAFTRLIEGLEKIQGLLPDPDATDGGEYAIGKEFTNADCAIVPLLAWIQLVTKDGPKGFDSDDGKAFVEAAIGPKFERLRRYTKVLLERESVKKVINKEGMEAGWKARQARG